MSIGYQNITKCQIGPAISDSDTTVLLENISDYVPFLNSPGDYVYAVLVDSSNSEIIKIDVAASSTSGLSAARGQGGTTARAWRRGTLLYQELTAESLDEIFQQASFRTVDYNPNGFLSPAYMGEKVFQDDATACKKRWWKSWDATSPIWLLIAGTICDGEQTTYPTDPEWDFSIPGDWENTWPVFTDNSNLYAAGDNDPNRQLGQVGGTPNSSSTPLLVSNVYGRAWKDVAAGGFFNIAIDKQGNLWSWGQNALGQLGLGGYATEDDPAIVSETEDWRSVFIGRSYNTASSFAIKTNGTLWAWGANGNGQLGLGDTTERLYPTQVGSVTTWLKVYSGTAHTWALRTDGTLWVTGHNNFGQLGLGDHVQRTSFVQVGSDTNWTDIGYIYAIKGGNIYKVNLATDVYELFHSGSWSKIATGKDHQLAIKTNGTLWSWGTNLYGQLGYGSPADHPDVSTPTQIGTDADWIAIAAGSYFSLGIRKDGTDYLTYGWGSNADGQVGNGTATLKFWAPEACIGGAIVSTKVDAGNDHSVFLWV